MPCLRVARGSNSRASLLLRCGRGHDPGSHSPGSVRAPFPPKNHPPGLFCGGAQGRSFAQGFVRARKKRRGQRLRQLKKKDKGTTKGSERRPVPEPTNLSREEKRRAKPCPGPQHRYFSPTTPGWTIPVCHLTAYQSPSPCCLHAEDLDGTNRYLPAVPATSGSVARGLGMGLGMGMGQN